MPSQSTPQLTKDDTGPSSQNRRLTPPSVYPRIVFGASALLFGTIALLWRDAETWQTLRHIWNLPFGMAIGACLMALQIGAAVTMQFPRAVRLASVVLSVVYFLFSLAAVPGILAAPRVYAQYPGFFEQFCLLCGTTALFAATDANPARSRALARLARLGLGLCAISFALTQLFYFRETAAMVPRWIPLNQSFWAILTTIAFGLAALAILIHRHARLAIHLMTLMLALFGALVWIPRLLAHPHAHSNWSEFALTALITGAAWLVGDLKSL
jgi:hypothetical protein